MPRIRIIVLLLVLAVAAALGFCATLPANNGQSSSSRTTQTTNRCPSPQRGQGRAARADPQLPGRSRRVPRVPWTFYAAMGKHSSDHGRHLKGGQVRVEDGLVRGVVTLTEEHRRALGSLPPGRQLRLHARHHDHRGQTAV